MNISWARTPFSVSYVALAFTKPFETDSWSGVGPGLECELRAQRGHTNHHAERRGVQGKCLTQMI